MTLRKVHVPFGKLIGDVPSATAILDRFLHHAEVIAITGRSYRLRNQSAPTAEPADAASETSKPAIPPTGSRRSDKRKKEAAAPAETCPS